LRDFPLSDFDDPVDAGSDLYNGLYEIARKGLVVKDLKPQRNLITYPQFKAVFGADTIPPVWTVYVGLKITAEATRPNSAVIVVRASQNTKMADVLFVVAEYKAFNADFYAMFDWIDTALDAYCGGGRDATVWLHPDSEQYSQVIWQKLQRRVAVFDGDAGDGLTELNWYLKPTEAENPFNPVEKAAGLYALVADEGQLSAATDEYGLYALRQEAATWGYNDKGEPSAVGAVMDCLRMCVRGFRTVQAGLSVEERIDERVGPKLSVEAIAAIDDPDQRDTAITKRMMETKKAARDIGRPVRGPYGSRRR
jgi:hypothetical protein